MSKRTQILLLAFLVGACIAYALFGLLPEQHAGGQDGTTTTTIERGTDVTASPPTTAQPVPIPMPIFHPEIKPPTEASCVKPMVRLLYPDLCKAETIPPLVIERPEPANVAPAYTG